MKRTYPEHGVARTSVFLAHGWTKYSLVRAREAGTLVNPARGWWARPGADAALLELAGTNLALSCVSLTSRLGLWQQGDTKHHYAVHGDRARVFPGGSVLHWRKPVIGRPHTLLIDRLENALVLVAECRPFEEAVAIWDAALKRGLVRRTVLARFPLGPKPRAVLEASTPFADSGLETIMRVRLRWLKVRMLPQAYILGRRVDFLLGERLVVQIDGGHHVGPQRTTDIEFDAKLALRGYTVIRLSYAQIMHHWHDVQEVIQTAIAQELHLAG